MTTRTLSPNKAASRAKCGRSSIMRALKSGQLRAIRDNSGNWQIAEGALDDWLSMRRSSGRTSPAMTASHLSATQADTPETLARLAVAEARTEVLTSQLDELRQDRDAWREQAQRLASEAHSRGFIARLFRRS